MSEKIDFQMRDLRHENLVPFIGACVETGHIGLRFVLLLNQLPDFFKRHIFLKVQRGFFQRSFVDSSLQIPGSLLWVD